MVLDALLLINSTQPRKDSTGSIDGTSEFAYNETIQNVPERGGRGDGGKNRMPFHEGTYRIVKAVQEKEKAQEKKTFLARLSDPLYIFISEKAGKERAASSYQSALLFPMSRKVGEVSLGTAIFMKQVKCDGKKLRMEKFI